MTRQSKCEWCYVMARGPEWYNKAARTSNEERDHKPDPSCPLHQFLISGFCLESLPRLPWMVDYNKLKMKQTFFIQNYFCLGVSEEYKPLVIEHICMKNAHKHTHTHTHTQTQTHKHTEHNLRNEEYT